MGGLKIISLSPTEILEKLCIEEDSRKSHATSDPSSWRFNKNVSTQITQLQPHVSFTLISTVRRLHVPVRGANCSKVTGEFFHNLTVHQINLAVHMMVHHGPFASSVTLPLCEYSVTCFLFCFYFSFRPSNTGHETMLHCKLKSIVVRTDSRVASLCNKSYKVLVMPSTSCNMLPQPWQRQR